MIKELQAECVKVKKEQEAAAAAARKKSSLAVPLSSSPTILLPPPFDRERDGVLVAATALFAALLGWSLSLSPRYTPLAALWSVLAAAAAVDASLHAAVAAGARRNDEAPSSMTSTSTGLLVRVKHETPAAARASLRSHPVVRRPRRPPQEDVAIGGGRGRAKSPSPSPSPAAAASNSSALWHIPRGAAAASQRMRRRARYETLAALLVLLASCAMALAVVAFLRRARHAAISLVALPAKKAFSFSSVRAKNVILPLLPPPLRSLPPPPPRPALPPPVLHLPDAIARYFPEMPPLPEVLPSLSFPIPAGAHSLHSSLEQTLARAGAAVRTAVESCVAAASGISAVLQEKGIEALSAAQPTLRNLEVVKRLVHSSSLSSSLKSALDSSSAIVAASHAALRRVAGRKGPHSKLWFQ